MKELDTWQSRFDNEIKKAQDARKNGKEGMARVCARRAAGIAVTEYLRQHDLDSPGASVYEQLKLLESLPEVSERARRLAEHLTLRVTPQYSLPIEADLIEDAQTLRLILLENEREARN